MLFLKCNTLSTNAKYYLKYIKLYTMQDLHIMIQWTFTFGIHIEQMSEIMNTYTKINSNYMYNVISNLLNDAS